VNKPHPFLPLTPRLAIALFLVMILSAVGCTDLTSSPTGGASLSTATSSGGATPTSAAGGTTGASALTAPGAWTELHPAGTPPYPRADHSMVFELFSGTAFAFGGSGDHYLNDTWGYDPLANTWISLGHVGATPEARFDCSMAYDSNEGKVILFGGQDEATEFNDTWVYERKADAWIYLNPSGGLPTTRCQASLVYDSSEKKAILFGGVARGPVYLNDTWAYDAATNTWTNLSPSGAVPPPRGLAGMVYDSRSGKVILFGGDNGSTRLGDTWAYDPAANTWTDLNPSGSVPAARSLFGMTYASNDGKAVLFGGADLGSNFFNDLWTYDLSANAWTQVHASGESPSARTGSALVFDSMSGDLLLFGGWDGETDLNDLWAYRLQ
jgi:N-acetylneuraminic acid mutarotase